jgi:hypothetical protein
MNVDAAYIVAAINGCSRSCELRDMAIRAVYEQGDNRLGVELVDAAAAAVYESDPVLAQGCTLLDVISLLAFEVQAALNDLRDL